MKEVTDILESSLDEWIPHGSIPEVDWARLRVIDFQEILQTRNSLAEQLKPLGCVLCAEFDAHVRHLLLICFKNIVRMLNELLVRNCTFQEGLAGEYREP